MSTEVHSVRYPQSVTRQARYCQLMSGLVTALLVVYLAGNGQVPLFDRDEPRYALTSRAMLETGDFVVPRLMDEVRTAKPPAIYWLQAGAMHLNGFNEFAVRLPGALGCAATVGLLAVTLPRLVGRRRAAWACFMFGTSVLVLGVAKVGVIDGVLVLCTAAMQLALLRLILRRGKAEASALMLWTAVGCGGLLKGPVILGVLATSLIAWWAVGRLSGARSSHHSLSLGTLRPFLGLGVVTIICAPWLLMIWQLEPRFIATALSHDVATRSVKGLEGHGQPPGFHLLALFGTWFPWSVLLPAAVLEAWRARRRVVIRFALAGTIGPWLMFELVVTKLPHYLLVIFPMLAILTADWMVRHLRQLRLQQRPPWGMKLAAMVYLVIMLGFAVAPFILGAPSVSATATAVGCAAAVTWTWWRTDLRLGSLVAGCSVPILVVIAFVGWLGRAPILTVSKRTAEALAQAGSRDVAMVHYREPSLAWYAQLRELRAREAEEAVLVSDQYDVAVCIAEEWSALPAEVRQRWQVLSTIQGRLYNERMRSDVVLILRRIPSAEVNMTE